MKRILAKFPAFLKFKFTSAPPSTATMSEYLTHPSAVPGKNENGKVILKVIDEGKGFKEKSTKKIFNRFYTNRPENFGEHSGLGLNIVKNLVDLHGGSINASNNINQKGANVEIIFPKI